MCMLNAGLFTIAINEFKKKNNSEGRVLLFLDPAFARIITPCAILKNELTF